MNELKPFVPFSALALSHYPQPSNPGMLKQITIAALIV
jgi:hypothetical protein